MKKVLLALFIIQMAIAQLFQNANIRSVLGTPITASGVTDKNITIRTNLLLPAPENIIKAVNE